MLLRTRIHPGPRITAIRWLGVGRLLCLGGWGWGAYGGVQIVTERSWRRVTRRKRGMAQRIVSKIR
jgi:hypothetical protein